MKLAPKNNIIIGRMVDIEQSKGGLILPTSEIKSVSVLMLVDSTGPDVKSCEPGDIILYEAMGHAYFRSGEHFGIVRDDKVIAVASDIDPTTIVIEGTKKRIDGKTVDPPVQPARPTA